MESNVDERMYFVLDCIRNKGGSLTKQASKSNQMWKPIYDSYENKYGKMDKSIQSCLRCDINTRARNKGFVRKIKGGWELTDKYYGGTIEENKSNRQTITMKKKTKPKIIKREVTVPDIQNAFMTNFLFYILIMNTFALFFVVGSLVL